MRRGRPPGATTANARLRALGANTLKHRRTHGLQRCVQLPRVAHRAAFEAAFQSCYSRFLNRDPRIDRVIGRFRAEPPVTISLNPCEKAHAVLDDRVAGGGTRHGYRRVGRSPACRWSACRTTAAHWCARRDAAGVRHPRPYLSPGTTVTLNCAPPAVAPTVTGRCTQRQWHVRPVSVGVFVGWNTNANCTRFATA